ncbi:hypothetical protein SKAU_G00177180 [Synaphobranchus kaupii]|uniref:Uncharacterized protein n=1 Tax=Synaphobranchus kaupii TaxID=118154 RepID=A0A9Q1FLH8_SYNKA|nr:hypothetical protein SKAU_G00177180 [Synaphobranchus kaupii]
MLPCFSASSAASQKVVSVGPVRGLGASALSWCLSRARRLGAAVRPDSFEGGWSAQTAGKIKLIAVDRAGSLRENTVSTSGSCAGQPSDSRRDGHRFRPAGRTGRGPSMMSPLGTPSSGWNAWMHHRLSDTWTFRLGALPVPVWESGSTEQLPQPGHAAQADDITNGQHWKFR